MKASAVLLSASIAANVVCCAAVLFNAPEPPAANGMPATAPQPVEREGGQSAERGNTRHTSSGGVRENTGDTIWARLHDADPEFFETSLRSAGVPEHAISALLAAEARERVRERQRSSSAVGTRPSGSTLVVTTQGSYPGPLSRSFDFIDPSRRDRARTVAADYDAMLADIRGDGRLLTEAEKELIATLELERRRDLEAFLTPRELNDLEILKSPLYPNLVVDTHVMSPTLEEFRDVYSWANEASKRFGSKNFGSLPSSTENLTAVRQFWKQADEHLLAQLGAARFSEFERARNRDYRELLNLTQRLNLPAARAVEVHSIRDYVSAESGRIFDDATLSLDQKRAALRSLVADSRVDIQRQLGAQGADAYLKSANRWLNSVEFGGAVTFDASGLQIRFLLASPPDGG